MQIGIVYPELERLAAVDFAEQAEQKGFESVWVGELWGGNAFVRLAQIAERTSSIRLGTAIVNVFSRSPAVLAMGAGSLAKASDGRFVLGLGASTPKVIEDLHGFEYADPIQRTEETVELVRAFLSPGGEAVRYEGEVFDVKDFPSLDEPVPIVNAALGPTNRQVTGQLFDGWMPNNLPRTNLEASHETVESAAQSAGRDPADVEVLPWVHVAISEDGTRARDAIREVVAYYVGSASAYENLVKTAFPEEVATVVDAWRSGDTETARQSVTDEMVDTLGFGGTREQVHEQLRAFGENPLVDVPIVSIPHHLDDDLIRETFDALDPTLLAENE